jgi:hypothetical protein
VYNSTETEDEQRDRNTEFTNKSSFGIIKTIHYSTLLTTEVSYEVPKYVYIPRPHVAIKLIYVGKVDCISI